MAASKLFIVPTPVGNLEDITLRALRILKEVDLILAEDTRQTKKLLDHYNIQKQLVAYHKFNEHKTVESVTEKLNSGLSIALVSDGGTPGISDPGHILIAACVKQNITIECLPGATAFVPALINSGFATDEFVFIGFLPHKKGRMTKLKEIALEERTIILYESPFRVLKLLEELKLHIGERRISTSREISKMFEETNRGTAEELIAHFTKKEPRGEFVVIIAGNE
ncbi:MAG: S-adenosylmethionine-dependent methyltransferase, YraL family [Bacteroidota bacterium]|nr:S-adenosylmethionine-dependent methyltransferase, YraL family [Bacteroidota bacterium]